MEAVGKYAELEDKHLASFKNITHEEAPEETTTPIAVKTKRAMSISSENVRIIQYKKPITNFSFFNLEHEY